MDTQVSGYLRSHTPSAEELFVLWGGANDFFAGQEDATAPVAELVDIISALEAEGASSFFVVNIAQNWGTNELLNTGLTRHAEQFNQELLRQLEELEGTHPNISITLFDFATLFAQILADPAAFGFSDAVNPACIDCAQWQGGSLPDQFSDIVDNPAEFFFWDDVHPSAAAHQLIGDAAYSVLVPEPGSFFLIGVGLVFGGAMFVRGAFLARLGSQRNVGVLSLNAESGDNASQPRPQGGCDTTN